MTERINDIKFNLNKLSDSEVINMLGYAAIRGRQAMEDADKLLEEARLRGLIKQEEE